MALTFGAVIPAVAGTADVTSGRSVVFGHCPGLSDGLYLTGINAATLVDLTHMQFGFTHVIYPVNKTYGEVVGGAYPLGDFGTVSGVFGTTRVGDIEQYGPTGEPLGDYLFHDDRVVGGYGVNVAKWAAVGGALNYNQHYHSPDTNYSTYGADAGFYARPSLLKPEWEYAFGKLAAGISVRNLLASTRGVYSGEYREPILTTVGAAWSRDVGENRLVIAASLPLDASSGPSLGTEFLYASIISGCAGLTNGHPAFGLGFNTDLFSFDYAYSARGLGNYHYASLSVNPGRDIHASGTRRRQIERWIEEGRSYYEAGSYELAAERFANVLIWEPRHKIARPYWARSKYGQYVAEGNNYVAQKDWDRARRAYAAALVVVPDDFLANEYLAHVDHLEEEERVRREEEIRVSSLLDDADAYKRKRVYRKAIGICEDILRQHPDNDRAAKILSDARRLLALETKKPEETTKPPEIPAEVVARYKEGSGLLARGATGDAARILAGIVDEYPTYAEARAKLVDAYLYQGLDFYSKGSLTAALRVWKRALALDPGNDKIGRYIKKAESELDQIR